MTFKEIPIHSIEYRLDENDGSIIASEKLRVNKNDMLQVEGDNLILAINFSKNIQGTVSMKQTAGMMDKDVCENLIADLSSRIAMMYLTRHPDATSRVRTEVAASSFKEAGKMSDSDLEELK